MKITVGKKLIAAFSFILIVLILMGLMGLNAMGNMNGKVTEITESWVPGVESINDLNYRTEHILALEMKLALVRDPDKLKQIEDKIDQTFTHIDEVMMVYEGTIFLPEDRKNFDMFKKEWESYKELHARMAETAKAIDIIQGAGPEKGQQLYDMLDESEKRFGEMQTYLDALVKLNHEGAVKAAEESHNLYQAGLRETIIIIVVAMVVTIGIGWFLTRNIRGPVTQLELRVKEVAEGNLTGEPLIVKNRDEIGSLTASFNQMSASLRKLITQVSTSSEQVAASSEQLTASAEQTSKATEVITETVQLLASGADRQVNSVQECANVLADMAKGVQQIASRSQEAVHSAVQATELAVEGNQSIHQAVHQMDTIHATMSHLADVVKRLGERSEEIGQITSLISSIAAQTNLLALNAAIEAARAGEQGRGFAVVADEVRKLAEQSSQSALQIASLVTTIQNDTSQAIHSMESGMAEVSTGIGVVTSAGESFRQIKDTVETVATQIEEVSAATQQISASSEQVVAAVEQIAEISELSGRETQGASAATEEQLATMEEIASSAASLAKMAEELRTSVAAFRV